VYIQRITEEAKQRMSNEIHRITDEAAQKTTEEANEAQKESLLRE
jgi:hypothetical protein